ncbi:cardiolipin synthase [Chitinophaga pinensis]|uniref:Cardiolipin synthase n=1 Tax=Chitinophaga pinensis (strain ATCC 43595 / DSM 2588 / LMG 13176 / NBRC 15968 / NCIMB 11800 / UQM 2034) TaxID=485918 RepID=A0A979GSY4_CHIPD|nr:cardiolipin synthase [Chitinophaga pinensis]ACU58250.1 phospholipase D/Transphosphatidylase [Chitinophaga pinensis DSM 2588]
MYQVLYFLWGTNWHIALKIIGYVLISLSFLGVVGTILLENRNPVKAMAYIMLLVFVPILGLVVYYYLGRDLRKKRRFTLKGSKDETLMLRYWESQRKEIDQMQLQLRKQVASKQEISAMLLNTRHSVLSCDNRVQLLLNGEEKFPAVMDALRAAKHHIHIEYYIFAADDVGNAIAEILLEKLRAGVEVRFIYDDLGCDKIGDIPDLLEENGAEVFAFSPVLINFYLNANYRNHRKIIIIDGEVGFTGGINIDDRYLNNAKHPVFWRDTHLKLEGDVVNLLQLQFMMSYRYCSKQTFPFSPPYFHRSDLNENCFADIVASGPDSEFPMAMQTILMAINNARRSIRISNPYFIPNEQILTALQMAALSGKTVQLILPFRGDSFFVQHAAQSYIKSLLDAGVKVYFYQKGFIHAKSIAIDDNLAIVGSVNLDYRSFYLNSEIAVVVYDKTFVHKLNAAFEQDLQDSEHIDRRSWRNRSLWQKFIDGVCRLLTPLL